MTRWKWSLKVYWNSNLFQEGSGLTSSVPAVVEVNEWKSMSTFPTGHPALVDDLQTCCTKASVGSDDKLQRRLMQYYDNTVLQGVVLCTAVRMERKRHVTEDRPVGQDNDPKHKSKRTRWWLHMMEDQHSLHTKPLGAGLGWTGQKATSAKLVSTVERTSWVCLAAHWGFNSTDHHMKCCFYLLDLFVVCFYDRNISVSVTVNGPVCESDFSVLTSQQCAAKMVSCQNKQQKQMNCWTVFSNSNTFCQSGCLCWTSKPILFWQVAGSFMYCDKSEWK